MRSLKMVNLWALAVSMRYIDEVLHKSMRRRSGTLSSSCSFHQSMHVDA